MEVALCKKSTDRCVKGNWYVYDISEEYNSYFREYETFMYVYFNLDFSSEYFSENEFFDYFYTEKELRKLKLEKLNLL